MADQRQQVNDLLIPFLMEREAYAPGAQHESRKGSDMHHAYKDEAGVWTIGYGHTEGVEPGMVWDEAQAQAALVADIDKSGWANFDKAGFDKLDLTPGQQAAVVSMSFNAGFLPKVAPNATAALRAGDWETFREETADPVKGITKVSLGDGSKVISDGLVARRRMDFELAEGSYQLSWANDRFNDPQIMMARNQDPRFYTDEEIPFDPNDRGEMKAGFRHEQDVMRSTPNPPLANPDDLRMVMASTTPQVPSEEQAVVEELQDVAPGVDLEQPEPEVAPGERLRVPPSRSVMPSNAQIVAAGKPDAPAHSWGDEWAAAFRVDNSAGRLLSKEEADFPLDPNFDSQSFIKANERRIKELTAAGADAEEIGLELGSSWSDMHAESRLRQMESDVKDELLLAEGGGSALLARLGAAIADPVDMAVALSTGGLGAMVKAGRAGKIITSALSASAAAGTTEAMLSSDNVMRDETDVAFAALAGLTMGGALGTWTTRELGEFNRLAKEVADGNIDAAADRLLGDSAGAQRANPQSTTPNAPLYATPDEALAAMEAPEFRFKALNKMLGNLQGRLFHSKSDTVRKLGSAMFEGGFLKDKGKTRAATAEGQATMMDMVFQRNVYAETLGDFKSWSKRNGYGAVRREMTTSVGEEFYSQVGRAMRGLTDGIDPEAAAAAGKIRKQMENIYQLAVRAGVEGFEEGRMLDNYFPRVLNKGSFTSARIKYGDEAMADFFKRSMLRANDFLDEEMATKVSKAYVRIMREKAAGIEDDLLHGIRLDDLDRLRAGWDGAPPPEVKALIDDLERIKTEELGERGQLSVTKRRINFDESFESDMVDLDGLTSAKPLKFTDLYENDARLVLARYSRAVNGHIAMAEKLGVKSRMDFERLSKEAASDAEMAGEDARKIEQALRDGYDLMLGQPIDRWNPNGDAAQLSRMFSAYNYGGRGGQFGVNALAELGNVVAQGGFRSMLRIFPDLKRVMARAADGELEHDLARFVELNFAPGVHTLVTPAVRNLDELAEGFGGHSVIQKFAATMDPYLKSLGRQVSLTSGLGPITDATQRLAAVRHVERLARFAKRKPSQKQADRLRASGLSDEMQERVFEMLRVAGKYRKGRLVDIDMDKWTDGEALKAFSESSSRVTREAIQMPDISTSTVLFNHPAGRLVFQFMRFPMDAVNKQLARHYHHMDGETATAAVASFGIASTVYIAQQAIEFANDPEELKKRLAPEQIAKIGFMRTGYSSLLPGIMDSALWAAGFDPQFSMGRSSGLSTIFPIANNPTTTLLKNAGTFAGGITRSALQPDIQFSQADMRAGLQTLPYYRTLGLKNLWHAAEEQFPESRQQE